MALNKFMHPRNLYKHNRPDFSKLGEKYPDFKSFLTFSDKGKASLDFKDPEALKALTCTLLKEDFDIKLDVPLDHIIPTVPLRLNYIHWLEDLLEGTPNIGSIWGIDIGCGTSCIYPLLGAKMNGWHFWALEVDPLGLQYANENVEVNKLGHQIRVIENTNESLFLDLLNSSEYEQPKFHFTMCNPPFFGNLLEAQGFMSSRSCDRPEPSSVSTADEGEMIVEGGEVEFVKKMISESCQVADRVLWFTSMLGKKSSVGQVVAELKKEKVPTWTTTEFCQGRTMRWGVAWSYQRTAKKHSPGKKKSKEKPPLAIQVPPTYIDKLFQKLEPDSRDGRQSRGRQEKILAVAMAMEEIMKNLKMAITKQLVSTKWNPKFELVANRNTWSHQRRKRRQSKSKKGRKKQLQETESRPIQETSTSHASASGHPATHTPTQRSPGDAQKIIQTADAGNTIYKQGILEESAPVQRDDRHIDTGLETPLLDPALNGSSTHSESTRSLVLSESERDHSPDNNNTLAQVKTNKEGIVVERSTRKDSDFCCNEKKDLLIKRKERHVTWREEDCSDLLEGKPPVKQRKLTNSEAAVIKDGIDGTMGCHGDISGTEQYQVPSSNVTEKECLPTTTKPMCDLRNYLHNKINIHDAQECKVRIDEYALQKEEAHPPKGSWRPASGQHVHSAICMSSSDPGSGSDADQGPLIKFILEVKIVTKGVIEVVFSCDAGQSREILHQIAQYVKNHITKETKG
ncbi:putative methyltransferase-like protein 16 [Apostichopus japonicus]|uniref:RNA N(6)-adenosine-methyltransferase METTL16 n=1 Tax=Stichopus japonicus TaxID=307972 RepID=A0A2G8KSE6_STIJA|nr:putative methyltransferase-like protein 16 [Apostichopus japonicus]